MIRAGRGTIPVPLCFAAAVTGEERAPDPQFFHHRPHRPRQIDAGGPVHPALRRLGRARDGRAGAGFDGPRARARHHDQGADRRALVQGARRADLQPQPDRHAGPRRLRLRGLALPCRVRGRAAGRRRLAGRRGADGGELLYRNRAGGDGRAGLEQDRPAVGRARPGDRGDRGHHRHTGARRAALQREDRRGRRRHPRGGHRAHTRAQGERGTAAAGAHHRFVVRQLCRRGHAGPRDAGDIEAARQDPADGRRGHVQLRAGRRLHSEVGAARVAVGGRCRLHHRGDQGNPRGEGGRHGDARVASGRRRAAGIQGREAAGVRRTLSGGIEPVRGAARRARQAQAERRVAALRARSVAGARLRLPLRLPRLPAHGHRAGAPRARIRHGPDHDGADRHLSDPVARRLRDRDRESVQAARSVARGGDPGARSSRRRS